MRHPNVKTKMPFVVSIVLIFGYSGFLAIAPPKPVGAEVAVTQSEDAPASLLRGMVAKTKKLHAKPAASALPIN